MNAIQIRQDAIQAGVSITLNGDKLRLVSKDGALSPDLKRKLVKAKPEIIAMLKAEKIVAECIQGLPTTVSEVIESFFRPTAEHVEMLVDGEFENEIIRQHIASWLLSGKRDLFLMKHDAAEQLMRKATNSESCLHTVCCRDCMHFRRTDHPNLGHCAKGQPEASAGLWDSDRRYCGKYQQVCEIIETSTD